VKATRRSSCEACGTAIRVGQSISRAEGLTTWVHASCADSIRNRVLVNHGLTFAGTPKSYRRKVRRD